MRTSVCAFGFGLVLAAAVVNLWLVGQSVLDPTVKSDLKAEYLMASALAAGGDPYASLDVLAVPWLPDGVGRLAHPTPHPIFVGWIFLPLAVLPFTSAALAWFGVEIACLLAGLRLWRNLAGPVPWWTSIVLVGWFPVAMELRLGQLSILLTVLFLGAWLALARGRDAVAGLLLGALVLLKLAGLPILAWLLWRRRWTAVGVAVGLVLLAHLVAVGVHGPALLLRYYTDVGPRVTAEYATAPANLSAWTWSPWALAGPTVLGVILLWLTRRQSLDSALPVLFGGGLFLAPVVWTHTLVMALPAIGQLARLRPGLAVTAAALLAVPEVFYLDAGAMAIPVVATLGLVSALSFTTPRMAQAPSPPGTAPPISPGHGLA